jgi:6-phosphogluconolactonase
MNASWGSALEPGLGPVVVVCPDREVLAEQALDLTLDGLQAAIRRRGEAHLALTGGSSAAALLTRLRGHPRSHRLEWGRVHVWQGDERFVTLDHEESNWAAAQRDWLAARPAMAVPPENQHPIPVAEAIAGGHDAAWAASRYAGTMTDHLPRRCGLPAFDVWLLGVGSDGHILSAFPGSAAVRDVEALALAVPAPGHIEPHLPRVTLSPHLLPSAGTILVMIPGAAKAAIVAECFRAPLAPERLPAQLALRPNAIWLLEPGSAAGL